MLASVLPLSFLETYNLSLLSLGCNALCIVISFLVLWVHLFTFVYGPLQKGPGISNEWYSPGICSCDKVSAGEFCIIIIHSLELFTSALADGFSLES